MSIKYANIIAYKEVYTNNENLYLEADVDCDEVLRGIESRVYTNDDCKEMAISIRNRFKDLTKNEKIKPIEIKPIGILLKLEGHSDFVVYSDLSLDEQWGLCVCGKKIKLSMEHYKEYNINTITEILIKIMELNDITKEEMEYINLPVGTIVPTIYSLNTFDYSTHSCSYLHFNFTLHAIVGAKVTHDALRGRCEGEVHGNQILDLTYKLKTMNTFD